ncbi:MAG: alanine dehydrogenase [Ignavibacteriae bacterium]|nr:alanine dehydrogenase [Ignavibacteriota bacterium]
MHIGVPREIRADEYRVGLTPAGVELLTHGGHTCYVEREAGLGAGFSDLDYERAGARIVYSPSELYGRSGMVIKVGRPTAEELEMIQDGTILMGFLHLPVTRAEKIARILTKKITAFSYELIQEEDGTLPVQVPLSIAAGRMSPQIAAILMQNNHGGKGILLGGVPGVPPAEVVLIGAGRYGTSAAQAFLRQGASVYVLDQDLKRLEALDEQAGGGGRLVTMVSHQFNIRKVIKFADVVVGSVFVPGTRSPILITREMVKLMKPRSIIMDVCIDQGGCVETSRPTSHRDPVFIEENIIHYCVPNMTSAVARTATHAFNNAAWPYIQQVAKYGLDDAMARSHPLSLGVAIHNGRVLNPSLAASLSGKERPR